MLTTTLLLVTAAVALASIATATRPIRRDNPFYC